MSTPSNIATHTLIRQKGREQASDWVSDKTKEYLQGFLDATPWWRVMFSAIFCTFLHFQIGAASRKLEA